MNVSEKSGISVEVMENIGGFNADMRSKDVSVMLRFCDSWGIKYYHVVNT